MFDSVLDGLSKIKLPKKYKNRKIYKECLKFYTEGIKKNM